MDTQLFRSSSVTVCNNETRISDLLYPWRVILGIRRQRAEQWLLPPHSTLNNWPFLIFIIVSKS